MWPTSISILAGQGHIEEVLLSISPLNQNSFFCFFGESQISRDQFSWSEPVNCFTKERIVWTVNNFHFHLKLLYSKLLAHFHSPPKCKVASLVLTKLLPSLNCTPPLAITDPIAAFTGLLWNNIDSNGYLDFLIQLYLFWNCRRNRKIGYGRVVAERPTGIRAGCRSAFGGSRTLGPVRPAVRPNQRGTTLTNSQPTACWKGWVGWASAKAKSPEISPADLNQLTVSQKSELCEPWTTFTFTLSSFIQSC